MSKLNADAAYPQRKPKYVPVTKEVAAERIAIGLQTGLRMGSEAPSADALWKAISASGDSAWTDAANYCVDVLAATGLVVCRETEL